MNILITGVCGFVGSTVARELQKAMPGVVIHGMDNLSRPGSELNRRGLIEQGVRFVHADIRNQADIDSLPAVEWVIDAAANPSVLAGVTGSAGTRSVVENNLVGTVNLLEYCKRLKAGFTLLSTSRVYSIASLCQIPVTGDDTSFRLSGPLTQVGLTDRGVDEAFSTEPPVSLYGCTKLCSERLALEYGAAFGFPVWINRCGVMAGAGQFGRPDQGIFAYWLHSWLERKPLKYIGFGGTGRQVRDCLHPRDLVPLLTRQMAAGQGTTQPKVINLSGGLASAMSLAELSAWCERRWGPHPVASDLTPRLFDLPWVVLDHSLATSTWGWTPATSVHEVLEEIAAFAEQHRDWLSVSNA